jgi:hypothetical protein
MDDLRFSGDFSSDFSVFYKNSDCRTFWAAVFLINVTIQQIGVYRSDARDAEFKM